MKMISLYVMSKVLINGSFFSLEDAKISPFDRGFIYGDSVYEVVLIYNGKLFFSLEHSQRMVNSLNMVHINTFDVKRISEIIDSIYNENKDIKYGFVYLQISRGIQYKRYAKADSSKPTIVGYVESILPEDFYQDKIGSTRQISSKIVKDPRRFQRNIKINSLMPMVIAKYEASLEGFDDIIFEDRLTGNISESATSNLFIVSQNGDVLTHPTGNEILPGTTRFFLIEVMKKAGFNVLETFFKKEDVYNAKEVFVTGAVKLVVPVTRVDNFTINSGIVGDISKFCQNSIMDFISK